MVVDAVVIDVATGRGVGGTVVVDVVEVVEGTVVVVTIGATVVVVVGSTKTGTTVVVVTIGGPVVVVVVDTPGGPVLGETSDELSKTGTAPITVVAETGILTVKRV